MPPMTDLELLQDYATSKSEDAFTSLVQRYTGLVYSAALRQLGDPQAAEEVAQVVFIIMARKAGSLPKKTVIPGWLWRTTRFVALNARRHEAHRRQTERDAVAFYRTETEAAWISLAPIIDEALGGLGEKDRNAVILRFFDQKTFREIAQGLGTSEDGAQKRVSRALEKLRRILLKQGVMLSATVVAGAINAKAVAAAPSGLAATLVHGALSGAGAAGSTASLANTTLKALEALRRRTLALRTAGAAVVILLGWLLVRFYEFGGTPPRTRDVPNTLPIAGPSAPAAAPRNGIPGQQVPRNLRQVGLLVLDSQTRRPIANAQLEVQWDTRFPDTSITNLQATDQEGRAVIDYDSNAQEPWNLLVVILKAGFVPKFVNWAAARGDLLEDIPSTYTTILERGIVAGGVVMDQVGQPISEAKVLVSGPGPNAEREGVALTHTEVADAQGRWICDHLPSRFDAVGFYLSHPDYLGAMVGCTKFGATTNQGILFVSESDLLNGTTIFRLQRGLIVAGTVVDGAGHPLAGARVIKNRHWSETSASGSTDAQGRFHFGDVTQEELVLTAKAEGFLEADMVIQPSGQDGDLRFVLARAATLRGRILDDKTNPIVRARIVASGQDYQNGKRYWSTRTDAEGRFQWLSAPPSQTNYEISASGYKGLNQELLPNGIEQTVILQRIPRPKHWRVAGRVLEANSHKPVQQFQVWVAATLGPHGPSGFPNSVGLGARLTTTGTSGSFALLAPEYADPMENLELEVRSEGYLAAKRTIPGPITNEVWLNMDLEPTSTLSGTVQLPDGRAATGAVVMLSEPITGHMGSMVLPSQIDLQSSSAAHTETDAEGRFSLPAESMSGTLLAAHKEGYAELDLKTSVTYRAIRLHPWGRIVGTLRLGSQPAQNKALLLGNDYDSKVNSDPFLLARTATTDAEGRFVMEGVPPGEWRIEPHHARVRVRAGETTQVVFGGGGARLVGKVVLKNPAEPVDLRLLSVGVNTKWFPTPPPRRDQFGSLQEYITAKNQWMNQVFEFKDSPAGREDRRDQRAYSAILQPDGSFTIDEVLPGSYELSVGGDPIRFDGIQMSLFGDATIDVLVPEPEPGKAAILDVGVVEIDLNKR
jgi:RNA polymerase sigma factor (sigma-70 family)